MKRIVSILLVLMLCMAMLPAAAMAASTVYVSINGGTLNLRAGAGKEYESIGYVKHGDSVTSKGSIGEWSKVYVKRTGKTGYIKTMYIDGTTKALANGKKNIKTDTTLNMRKGPGSAYGIKAVMVAGDTVQVLQTEDGWAKVTSTFLGVTGWIKIKYIGSTASTTPPPEIKPAGLQKVYHVTASALNVRSGPGTSYSKINMFYSGQAVKVLATSGNWYRVMSSTGVTGWVSKNYLAAGATATVKTNSSNLNVRSGPGTSYGIRGSLAKGSKVTVDAITGNWGHLYTSKVSGYSSLTYLKF